MHLFKLIKQVELYDPIYQGKRDILICGDKIVKISENIEYPDAYVIDKAGFITMPGIIDQHVHITGGGGEGGFHTRTPEVQLSDLIKGGVTTVVGLLGTDSITKGIEGLVAKTKALKNEGLSAYCLTGAYTYPSITLTGGVDKDLAFIEEVIGVKLALSDHREPHITKEELKKLAAGIRVSSMISGKSGFITLHMGDDPKGLKMIFDIIKETSIPITHFRPTHVNRTDDLFQDALTFLKQGGMIDLTVGAQLEKVKKKLEVIDKKYLSQVTFSSDGNGSFSKYDEAGKLIEMGVQGCGGILKMIQYLIQNGYGVEESIKFGTSHVSQALNFTHKGYVQVNKDADLLILDANYNLDTVIARGEIFMAHKKIIKKGTYEI